MSGRGTGSLQLEVPLTCAYETHDDCCCLDSQWYGIVCDRHERIQAMYARPLSLQAWSAATN